MHRGGGRECPVSPLPSLLLAPHLTLGFTIQSVARKPLKPVASDDYAVREVPCTDLTVTGSIISSWFSGAQVGGRIENGVQGEEREREKKFWLEFPWHKERWGGGPEIGED